MHVIFTIISISSLHSSLQHKITMDMTHYSYIPIHLCTDFAKQTFVISLTHFSKSSNVLRFLIYPFLHDCCLAGVLYHGFRTPKMTWGGTYSGHYLIIKWPVVTCVRFLWFWDYHLSYYTQSKDDGFGIVKPNTNLEMHSSIAHFQHLSLFVWLFE